MSARDFENFIDGLGLRHFKGKEFTPYWSRMRGKVRNSMPHESLWPNIVRTIIVLDEIRDRLGTAISLTSTYRNPAYNRAVGGELNSFHMRFMAIDFQSPNDMAPRKLSSMAKSMRGKTFALPADEGSFIFRGGIGLYPTFVHIDCRGYDANW